MANEFADKYGLTLEERKRLAEPIPPIRAIGTAGKYWLNKLKGLNWNAFRDIGGQMAGLPPEGTAEKKIPYPLGIGRMLERPVPTTEEDDNRAVLRDTAAQRIPQEQPSVLKPETEWISDGKKHIEYGLSLPFGTQDNNPSDASVQRITPQEQPKVLKPETDKSPWGGWNVLKHLMYALSMGGKPYATAMLGNELAKEQAERKYAFNKETAAGKSTTLEDIRKLDLASKQREQDNYDNIMRLWQNSGIPMNTREGEDEFAREFPAQYYRWKMLISGKGTPTLIEQLGGFGNMGMNQPASVDNNDGEPNLEQINKYFWQK